MRNRRIDSPPAGLFTGQRIRCYGAGLMWKAQIGCPAPLDVLLGEFVYQLGSSYLQLSASSTSNFFFSLNYCLQRPLWLLRSSLPASRRDRSDSCSLNTSFIVWFLLTPELLCSGSVVFFCCCYCLLLFLVLTTCYALTTLIPLTTTLLRYQKRR